MGRALQEIAPTLPEMTEMTRHLLIALQPRHAETPHPIGMESNHLGYDSTAQSRQDPSLLSTRFPLFVQRKVSLPHAIQIKEEEN